MTAARAYALGLAAFAATALAILARAYAAGAPPFA